MYLDLGMYLARPPAIAARLMAASLYVWLLFLFPFAQLYTPPPPSLVLIYPRYMTDFAARALGYVFLFISAHVSLPSSRGTWHLTHLGHTYSCPEIRGWRRLRWR